MSVSCICGWIGRDWDDGVSHVIESAGLPGGPHEVWNPEGEMFGQLDDAAPPSPEQSTDQAEGGAAALHGERSAAPEPRKGPSRVTEDKEHN